MGWVFGKASSRLFWTFWRWCRTDARPNYLGNWKLPAKSSRWSGTWEVLWGWLLHCAQNITRWVRKLNLEYLFLDWWESHGEYITIFINKLDNILLLFWFDYVIQFNNGINLIIMKKTVPKLVKKLCTSQHFDEIYLKIDL